MENLRTPIAEKIDKPFLPKESKKCSVPFGASDSDVVASEPMKHVKRTDRRISRRPWFWMAVSVLLSSAVAEETSVQVLIAYHSKTGNTRALAVAVSEGVSSVGGAQATLMRVQDVSKTELLGADAIIVGSPVLNANLAPEVQSFINSWPFEGRPLENKLGAAFVTAGGFSAGEEEVQLGILRSMLVFGMLVVGGPDWKSPFGASAVTEEAPFETEPRTVAEPFLRKGRALGKRVARLALDLERASRNEGSQPP